MQTPQSFNLTRPGKIIKLIGITVGIQERKVLRNQIEIMI